MWKTVITNRYHFTAVLIIFEEFLFRRTPGAYIRHTRVAAEGQFPSGRVGLSDAEVPVFVDPHCGSVSVPAGVGKQEVLKTWQDLRGRGAVRKQRSGVRLNSRSIRHSCVSRNDWNLCQCESDFEYLSAILHYLIFKLFCPMDCLVITNV